VVNDPIAQATVPIGVGTEVAIGEKEAIAETEAIAAIAGDRGAAPGR